MGKKREMVDASEINLITNVARTRVENVEFKRYFNPVEILFVCSLKKIKLVLFIPVKYIASIINTHIYSKFNVKNQKGAVGQVERQEVPKRQDKKNCHVVS